MTEHKAENDPSPCSQTMGIAWESTTTGYIKYITDERYQKFSDEVKRWYKPYRCSSCSPPAQMRVKPLEWRRSGWVEAFAQPKGFGFWYSISPENPGHGPGDPPFTCYVIWGIPGNSKRDCLGSDFQSLDEAKAEALADYERRILSAIRTEGRP